MRRQKWRDWYVPRPGLVRIVSRTSGAIGTSHAVCPADPCLFSSFPSFFFSVFFFAMRAASCSNHQRGAERARSSETTNYSDALCDSDEASLSLCRDADLNNWILRSGSSSAAVGYRPAITTKLSNAASGATAHPRTLIHGKPARLAVTTILRISFRRARCLSCGRNPSCIGTSQAEENAALGTFDGGAESETPDEEDDGELDDEGRRGRTNRSLPSKNRSEGCCGVRRKKEKKVGVYTVS